MKVLGLTGSVGMGKSAAAAMLRRMGVSVHDADREVHDLLAPGGAALKEVTAAFPGVVRNGVLDRRALGRIVFADARASRTARCARHPAALRDRRRPALRPGRGDVGAQLYSARARDAAAGHECRALRRDPGKTAA